MKFSNNLSQCKTDSNWSVTELFRRVHYTLEKCSSYILCPLRVWLSMKSKNMLENYREIMWAYFSKQVQDSALGNILSWGPFTPQNMCLLQWNGEGSFRNWGVELTPNISYYLLLSVTSVNTVTNSAEC